MSLSRRLLTHVWLAGFAGVLALSTTGCGSSSGKPTPLDASDGATDGSSTDQAVDNVDHPDTAADAAPDASDAAKSDATADTGTHDARMEVGASCTDNARNGDETDTDCGGSCGRCGVGRACLVNADCASGACNASHICVECATAANCPGQDTECSVRACLNGACVVALVASGTVLQTQTAGDCHSRRCDGQGQVAQVNDDTDLPNDGNPCTRDVCTSGAPSNPPASTTTTCGTNQLCDGLGHCVGCLTGADCPGTDNECRTRVCTQNVCGFTYRAAGTPTATQTAGDCKLSTCDGNGNVAPANQDTDLPSNGNPCNVGQCASGTPSFAPLATGASCGGANICDGAGNCVQCVTAANCPGQDTDCQMRTCDTHGACGRLNVTAGTATATQTAGDCKVRQCNGTGSVVIATDNTDVPVDNNACTSDICVAGVPGNPARPVGSACGTGSHCDAAAHCVSCITAADCPATANACQAPTCVNGTCGTSQLSNGTPVVSQIPGDCKVIECDATGNPVTVVDNTDLPVDGNACTNDVCTGGVPSHTPVDAATSCGGTNTCDGQGHCAGCLLASECPGMDTICQTRTCDINSLTCGFDNVADATPAGTQTTGDCRTTVCDGAGSTRLAVDDTDTPEDNNPCTANSCNAGVPSNPPLAADTPCPTGFCDGQGHCVTCVRNSDCGVDSICLTHACDAAHSCRLGFVESGSPVGLQVVGDCQVQQCDGAGLPTSIPDNTDVPADDGNPCTQEVCSNGAPLHPPVAAGTLVGTQVTGDCSVVQCDGNGAVVSVASSTDIVDDGNPCTDDVCQGQTATHPPKAAGISCGGTNVCDGQGNCGPAPTPDAGTPDAGTPDATVDTGTAIDAAAGGCPSPFLFCDDFEDGNATGWTPLEQTGNTPGTWMTVTETGHAGSSTIDLQGTGPSTSYHYNFPSVTAVGGPWADQTVSVWIKPTATALSSDNNKAGVCARFSTGGSNTTTSAYCLFLRSDTGATTGR